MGITGLLPALKDVQVTRHISAYRGQTLGIDAYVWLHRGAYGCAQKLVLGERTDAYINYSMARIRMLRHHGVEPYIVFDGDRLPAKARTEEGREARRAESQARARQLLAEGKDKMAHDIFAKCVDVTPEMAYQLIKALRREKVAYIVAPYEADAQLAYLERCNVIDAVVTEDSDLLVFGCRTVLYKLDVNGSCIELRHDRLASSRGLPLHGFTESQFRQMAILSGCDYLDSIPGMGLKTAHRLLRKYQTVPKLLQAARMEGMRVPETYNEDFATAERTFVFQRVFSRAPDGSVQIVTLSPLLAADGAAVDADPCIGAPMSCEEARGIADGDIDPISRRAMVDLMPSASAGPSGTSARKPVRPAQAGPQPAAQRGIAQFFAKAPASQRPAQRAQASGGPSGSGASSASPLKHRSLNAPGDPVASRAQPTLRRSAAQCLALYANGSESEVVATGTRSKFFKIKSSPARASPESTRSPELQDIASSSPSRVGEDDAEVEALYASGFSQLQNVSSSAPSADAGNLRGMLSRIDASERAQLVPDASGHDGAISSPESVSATSEGTRVWARSSPPTPDPMDASPTRAAAHRRTSKAPAATVLGESRLANASVGPLHLSFAAVADEADEASLAKAGDSLRSRFTFADESGDATLLGAAVTGGKRKLDLCSPGAAFQGAVPGAEPQLKRTKSSMQLKRTASLGFGTSPSPGAAGAGAPLLRRHVSATTPSRPPLVGASARGAAPRAAEASSSRKKKQSVLPLTTTSPGSSTSNSLWAQFARR